LSIQRRHLAGGPCAINCACICARADSCARRTVSVIRLASFGSGDVLPKLTPDDSSSLRLVDTVFISKGLMGNSSKAIPEAHLHYLFNCHGRFPVFLSSRAFLWMKTFSAHVAAGLISATFRLPVESVILISADKQVIRIDAGSNIAPMKNPLSVGNGTVGQNP